MVCTFDPRPPFSRRLNALHVSSHAPAFVGLTGHTHSTVPGAYRRTVPRQNVGRYVPGLTPLSPPPKKRPACPPELKRPLPTVRESAVIPRLFFLSSLGRTQGDRRFWRERTDEGPDGSPRPSCAGPCRRPGWAMDFPAVGGPRPTRGHPIGLVPEARCAWLCSPGSWVEAVGSRPNSRRLSRARVRGAI